MKERRGSTTLLYGGYSDKILETLCALQCCETERYWDGGRSRSPCCFVLQGERKWNSCLLFDCPASFGFIVFPLLVSYCYLFLCWVHRSSLFHCVSSSLLLVSLLARGQVMRGSTFTSSTSTEELTPDHVSLDSVADSGRGSWTSCSSNSHDSFQSLPVPLLGRPLTWDHLVPGGFRHTQLAGPIAEVEAGPAGEGVVGAPGAGSGGGEDAKRLSRDSSELNQSRQSWASSSSLSDTYEGNYGTIKRRTADGASDAPGEGPDAPQSTAPIYKTVTSSTEKGLIGEGPLCVFSITSTVLWC